MGNLIKAEFRKILTTKVWWALLIPTVLLAFFWAFGVAGLAESIGEALKEELRDAPEAEQVLGADLDGIIESLPLAVIALARSMNVTVIFPMIFGALAFASEIQRKTITTTLLTAPSRAQVLIAKSVTYATWGAGFGLVIALFAVLGSLAGAGSYFPGAGDTILIVLAGVISCVLWTLLGVGFGALLGSSVGAIVTLLIYGLIVGPLGDIVLVNLVGEYVPGTLPNGASNGLAGSTAGDALVAGLQSLSDSSLVQIFGPEVFDGIVLGARFAAGGLGSLAWWASGLIFLAWAGVVLAFGLVMVKRRDIT